MSDPINLGSPAYVKRLLRERGLRPNRRWGQNFLIDNNLLARVAEAGELTPTDTVLEIGPGLGALTRELASRSAKVLAVEIDPGLYTVLTQETLAGIPNIRVLHGDFLEQDLAMLIPAELGPGRHPVVANIPYSVTSPVVVRLLEHRALFDRIVLMVQKEVADRMTASPGTGAYGSLTLFIHLFADAKAVHFVSRRAFLPAPDVDSEIIRMDVRETPRYPDIPEERYLAVVHAAFQQRRKTLLNALTGPALGWSKEEARERLESSSIDPTRRGETLTADEFAKLARS